MVAHTYFLAYGGAGVAVNKATLYAIKLYGFGGLVGGAKIY